MFLSPGSGSYPIGKNFIVNVAINSGGGLGINASEAVLKFDPEYLSVSNLSEGSSIFELWTTKPNYSNINGTISFGGGLPSAYKGSAGTVVSVTFTPKKLGTTKVSFSTGVVLAADGKGTNVFSSFGNGSYTIIEAGVEEKRPQKEEVEEPIKGILPPAPEVSSPTHPEEDVWYSDNSPEFIWKLLSDVSGISYSLDKEEAFELPSRSEGIVEFKTYEMVEDGDWYFHIKYQNRVGWGKTTDRRILVDATAPSLKDVMIDNEGDYTNPTPLLKFTSSDEVSGIDRYALILDSEPMEVQFEDFAGDMYRFKPLYPGEHEVNFVVYDKANNVASSSLKFNVEPLRPPIISDIPKVITTRDELIIRGTSFYPRVTIKIYIDQDGLDPIIVETTTDDQGGWNYFHKRRLKKGVYEVWAKVVDDRGAQSLNSAKEVLTVIKPSIVKTYGWLIILILLVIIVLLVLYIIYLRQSFKEERERIKTEINEAKLRLTDIFTALREEVDELMELADKQVGLSESERRVKEKLQEALNISQEFLDKEIGDVEKEVRLPKKDDHLK